MYKILISMLVVANTYALVPHEKLRMRIESLHQHNIIKITRGLEDGIKHGTHGKIIGRNGFYARGICLKANIKTSYWKLYRVTQAKMISLDGLYIWENLNYSPIPERYAYLKDRYLVKIPKDTPEKTFREELLEISKIREAKRKVLADTKEERLKNLYVLDQYFAEDEHLFLYGEKKIENYLSPDYAKLRREKELSNWLISLSASPFQFESLNDQKSSMLNFKVENIATHHQLEFVYAETDLVLVNPYSEEKYEQKLNEINLSYLNRINESHWFLGSKYANTTRRIGDVMNPKDRYQFGVLGFEYQSHPIDKHVKEGQWAMGYYPLYEIYQYDKFDKNLRVKERGTGENRYIRHDLFIKYSNYFNGDNRFAFDIHYRPVSDLDTEEFDSDNNLTDANLHLYLPVTKDLLVDFHARFLNDILLQRIYGVDSENTITAINLTYSLPIEL